jgi:hypothetical protein
MADNDTVVSGPWPRLPTALRVVSEPNETDGDALRARQLLDGLQSAEAQVRELTARLASTRQTLAEARTALAAVEAAAGAQAAAPLPGSQIAEATLRHGGAILRYGVLGLLGAVLLLAVRAWSSGYALRVTSDTPSFIALVGDMARRPFQAQSPFLDADVATQHATPYLQALAFAWRLAGGESPAALELGRFLAVAGTVVFGLTLWCVFLYVRRLAGTTAAWVSIPVLLGVFGPPHVIWASDLSLHAALYAGFFPQNVALATVLLTLLALDRRSSRSLVLACALAATTMLVHPFTGVLLCVLATAEACRLALASDPAARRAPIALGAGFWTGALWPAYTLDRAFAETGLRGIVFVALCVGAPFGVAALHTRRVLPASGRALVRLGRLLESPRTAFRLALVGMAGTATVAVWELALVHAPPAESARLAIYWVDERWRWPLMLAAGTVGLSGLARLARRGQIVPAVWFAGCFGLGALGALGLPLPVWYRFLLLCQVPLAVGVATVVAEAPRSRTAALVGATFALTLSVKVFTLVAAPPTVSYFGTSLQAVWTLGKHIPPGDGLVATDPATAYFIPAVSGRRVLTVDKGHVSSRRELALADDGYRLLHRFYAGGPDWWTAAQELWRRDVRYVVIEKHTTLEPETLAGFIWQTAALRTPEQRRALGVYFYENNRIGTLVYDSPDHAVYRLDQAKLFGTPSGPTPGGGA